MHAIIIMLCSTLGISFVIGVIRYIYLSQNKGTQQTLSSSWMDHIDVEIPDLSIENANDDLVATQVISMRGSWRLAQGRSLSSARFSVLKAEEYSKKL